RFGNVRTGEDLDGDLAPEFAVVGEIDPAHAALAQLALDLVALGDQLRRGTFSRRGRERARSVGRARAFRCRLDHPEDPSLILRSLFSRQKRQSATSGYAAKPGDHPGCMAQRGSKQWCRSQRWPT